MAISFSKLDNTDISELNSLDLSVEDKIKYLDYLCKEAKDNDDLKVRLVEIVKDDIFSDLKELKFDKLTDYIHLTENEEEIKRYCEYLVGASRYTSFYGSIKFFNTLHNFINIINDRKDLNIFFLRTLMDIEDIIIADSLLGNVSEFGHSRDIDKLYTDIINDIFKFDSMYASDGTNKKCVYVLLKALKEQMKDEYCIIDNKDELNEKIDESLSVYEDYLKDEKINISKFLGKCFDKYNSGYLIDKEYVDYAYLIGTEKPFYEVLRHSEWQKDFILTGFKKQDDCERYLSYVIKKSLKEDDGKYKFSFKKVSGKDYKDIDVYGDKSKYEDNDNANVNNDNNDIKDMSVKEMKDALINKTIGADVILKNIINKSLER